MLEDKAHCRLPTCAGRRPRRGKDRSAAVVRLFQPGDDPQQRGLARARRPQQRHQFAGGDAQAHVRSAVNVPNVFVMLRTSMPMRRPIRFPGRFVVMLKHNLQDF